VSEDDGSSKIFRDHNFLGKLCLAFRLRFSGWKMSSKNFWDIRIWQPSVVVISANLRANEQCNALRAPRDAFFRKWSSLRVPIYLLHPI
jgi:hypothetical protein